MNVDLELKDPAWAADAVGQIRDIATENRERLDACERVGEFPREVFEEVGRRGLMGVITPVEWGGSGGDAPEYCLTTEAMARYGLVSSQIQIQGQRWLIDWGTEAQKRAYLPGIANGSSHIFRSRFQNGERRPR